MLKKGIVLAGGSGSRLFPATLGVSKQIVPVYDKPMVYYPISVLMLAQLREILLICTPHDLSSFQRLLGTGEQWGVSIHYAVQAEPNGLAESFLIGSSFIQDSPVALVLGDNLFYGHGFSNILRRASDQSHGATIFGYHVQNPSAYGVVTFDPSGVIRSLEEKPLHPSSSFAIPGLYFFDSQVLEIARSLKPSQRGELEIIDVLKAYLQRGNLQLECLSRGFAWVDMGTHDSLLDAANFVASVEKRQGLKIACLEEIAWRNGWISEEQVLELARGYPNAYGSYVRNLVEQRR